MVVVTIIAMLTALLLPALNAARESARRATCINNQKNIGSAVLQYEGAKQQFPGYINQLMVPSYAPPYMVPPSPTPSPTSAAMGWFPVLLPYLGRMDLWEGMSSSGGNGWRTGVPGLGAGVQMPTSGPETMVPRGVFVRVNLAVCPDDNATSPCALSYVVNVGTGWPTYDSATETGVFRNLALMTTTTPRPVSTSSVKSAAQRPMLSEAAYPMDLPAARPSDFADIDTYMRRWYVCASIPTAPTAANPIPPFASANLNNSANNVYLTAQRFGFIWTAATRVSAPFLPSTWLPQKTMHPGIVIVTFCDGHTDALAEDALCSDCDCSVVQ
jgi:hypothetical protein